MTAPTLEVAPVLSTPETHIFEDPTPPVDPSSLPPRASDAQLAITYEVERTVREIRDGRWRRIALQFPDHMLVDAPRVTVPDEVKEDQQALRDYQLFHVSDPPTSLLLTLSSRVAAVHIYPIDTPRPTQALLASSTRTLRRRYGLLTRLSVEPVFGILINTLSVKNYLHVVDHVKELIAAAGKKSYTFVVGKINAAKVANFSEVGGWVVIGCWESSLIESQDFWKPIITPFELQLTLQDDAQRVWTGEWTGDFQALLRARAEAGAEASPAEEDEAGGAAETENGAAGEGWDSDEESAPPEFDLRTGRYVSHARPMRATAAASARKGVAAQINGTGTASGAAGHSLIKRANGDVAQIGGVVSPGAEFLRSQRTWRGLGSEFDALGDDEAGNPPSTEHASCSTTIDQETAPPRTPSIHARLSACPRRRDRDRILTTHPTIAESLLASLPTRSLIDLFHTSRHLRHFLAEYPLAWRTLSFRAPQPALGVNNPDGDALDGPARNAKQYALDALLIQVVVPFGTRLTSLDLCNTAVSGVRLVSRVLEPRVHTLQHLSVRGCKNVSIKYHLVPFLEPYVHPGSPWAKTTELALRSLYTYRCRHHRRRPYLPSSLMRRDSDSEPTHQLIEICHQLGIWTDTMWCTTPGGRCFRRKDYYSGRAAPGTNEVWVPFDRLWRSGCGRTRRVDMMENRSANSTEEEKN
ncbi:putative diphthamide biosynthesis protein [Neofusicoccum parvum UCRNP2]|uniref:S-adenosyl-L-methionine:L-histidine 3-amino-3-carboxypropyltransferase 2 n=1 Tax=Botryosphaeria parva (strain UCR-NP2) TaxID=1287680 RepID=R1ER50_BOTPV|nr:putative diphthamide biosynthesis protein [Neofusicoccum parvum UCRNP2]